MTVEPDLALRNLVAVIVRGDGVGVAQLLKASPALARARFQVGASRQTEQAYFLAQVQRYVWEGDTALHIAAAGYQAEIAGKLIAAGADVGARNRLGDEPLHAASVGSPGSRLWNPSAQVATIVCLIDAGAAPNAVNKLGVSPLHRAVRTRCAAAVRTLLEYGADPELRNKRGSTPLLLAMQNTGRGGSGSPAAKAQQQEIVRLLQSR